MQTTIAPNKLKVYAVKTALYNKKENIFPIIKSVADHQEREKLTTRWRKLEDGFFRAIELFFQIESHTTEVDNQAAYLEFKRKQLRKEKAKHEFLYKHRVESWYGNTSFNADYGMYECDKCGIAFHYSPSTVKKATATILSCACGLCVNEILKTEGKEILFHD